MKRRRNIVLNSVLAVMLLTVGVNSQVPASWLRWSVFEPANEEFTVNVVGNLYPGAGGLSGPNRRYLGKLSNIYFLISSDPIDSPRTYQLIREYAQSNGVRMPAAEHRTRNDVSFTDADGFNHRIVTIHSATRIYVAHGLSPDKDDPSVAKFCSSFDLRTETSGTDVPEPPKPSKPSLASANAGTAASTNELKSEVANTPYSGDASGKGSQPQSAANELRTPLKLLSKPSPSYTAMARIYEVSGDVVLRVKFLSTGQVGDVAVQKKLPFGLTQAALEAAKQIAFEPPTLNGSPTTVTKTVIYTFSIF